MNPIYANEDGKLKITTSQSQLIALDELVAEEASIQNALQNLAESYEAQVKILNDRMDRTQALIDRANGLGIMPTPPAPESEPVEDAPAEESVQEDTVPPLDGAEQAVSA